MIKTTNKQEVDFTISEITKNKVSIVLLGNFPNNESKEYKCYLEACNKIEGHKIVYQDSSLEKPGIQLFTNFEGNSKVFDFENYSTEWNSEKIIEFHSIFSQPLFTKFDKSIHVLENNKPLAILLLDTSKPSSHFEIVQDVAIQFANKPIVFSWMDLSENLNPKRVGLSGQKSSLFVDDLSKLNYHYAFPEDDSLFTVENLKEWINKLLEGKLERTMVSEPIPPPSNDPVKHIVLENFNKEIIDKEEDCLVFFHNKNCGACQKFYSTWEQIVDKLKVNPSIILAQTDGWANDYEFDPPISGLPDIRFFPKGNKSSPIKYSKADRSLSSLLNFVKINSYHPDSIPIHDEL